MHRLGEDARLALAADLVLQRHGGKPVMSITLTSDRRSLAMRVQLGPPHAGHHRICPPLRPGEAAHTFLFFTITLPLLG